jgi:hypothetical protein
MAMPARHSPEELPERMPLRPAVLEETLDPGFALQRREALAVVLDDEIGMHTYLLSLGVSPMVAVRHPLHHSGS